MANLTLEKLKEIFEETESKWNGDNAIQGLKILGKYFDPEESYLITGADHESIYSVYLQDALDRGLTEEDARKLSSLNWSINEDGEYFSCFV